MKNDTYNQNASPGFIEIYTLQMRLAQKKDRFALLTIGENKNNPAYMVFKDTKYGGWVFNASSITFVGALFHDAVVNQIVLNLLKPVHTSVIYSE